jgi:hypothetical protein
MTSRSDRQCFTFQRQASPKESSFRPMSIVYFSSRKREPRTNGNFRFGRATFRSYGNIERPLPAQLSRPRTRSAMSAKLKGFGRRPFAGALGLGAGPASESLVRRKPREGRGAVWLGGSYGDFGVADGSPMWRRGWRAAGVIVRSEHDALFRGRGCERRVWAQRLERVCGGREDIAFLLRRARGGEGDKHSEAGSATMIMRCRS